MARVRDLDGCVDQRGRDETVHLPSVEQLLRFPASPVSVMR